jgi:hypothetical protein
MPYAPLTTVQSVKEWRTPGGQPTTADDAVIQKVIGRASELIGRHCGRPNLAEVLTYSEFRFVAGASKRFFADRMWTLVLKNWPIVSVTSVIANTQTIPILTAAQVMSGAWGVYIENDGGIEARSLKFLGVQVMNPGAVQINYTAGYNGLANVPGGLQQACDQYVTEIMRSASNAVLKSQAMAGETTTFDTGDVNWGMSNRTLAMLQPYKDVAGWAL